MNLRTRVAACIAAGLAPALVTAANFDFCLTCHGADGNGNLGIHAPRIAGLEPWYLKSQLLAFQAGWRGVHADDAPGNEMRPVGQHLDATGIEAALAFVATLQPKEPAHTVTGNVAHGKELYAVCAACHGTNGEGNADTHGPALAHRTDWYLVTQMRNYRSGIRGSDPADASGQSMRAVAGTLPDDAAINDVIAYINTLR